MLLHFCDWVAEKVFFIEIVATTEQEEDMPNFRTL